MKQFFAVIYEVLLELGEARARGRLRRGGWDY